jgi:starch synthase
VSETSLRVLSVVSELYPWVKTGGLADVAAALPGALAAEGVAMRTLVPGYPAMLAALPAAAVSVHDFASLFGAPARLLAAEAGGLGLFVLDAPHLYARPGSPYAGPDGQDFADNAQRFAALARVGEQIGGGLVAGFVPDVVHAHDWQAGLTPAYLRLSDARRPPSVMTVHNLAFQGQFPAGLLATLGLPPHAYGIEGVEYYGAIGFLKAGLRYADRITTVSPSYAAEICTPAGGMGLDGLLQARRDVLHGILNGIDEQVWDPASDPHLPKPFSAARRAGRPPGQWGGASARPGALGCCRCWELPGWAAGASSSPCPGFWPQPHRPL